MSEEGTENVFESNSVPKPFAALPIRIAFGEIPVGRLVFGPVMDIPTYGSGPSLALTSVCREVGDVIGPDPLPGRIPLVNVVGVGTYQVPVP